MAATHDYQTTEVFACDLDASRVLVGQCGGLSAIVGDVSRSYVVMGCYAIETEHGTLYLDPAEKVEVLA